MRDYDKLDRLMDEFIRQSELKKEQLTEGAEEPLKFDASPQDLSKSQKKSWWQPMKRSKKVKSKVEPQIAPSSKETTEVGRGVKAVKAITNLMFYVFLAMVLMVVAFSMQDGSRYASAMGYSPFYVETASMNSVIPRGSLIISKQVDAESLVVGDDITFYDGVNTQSMITHRIIKIHPNFENKGLAFETKGVDNKDPDLEKVHAKEVAGKVVVVLPSVGIYLSYVKDNLVMVMVFVGLIFATLHTTSVYLRERQNEKQQLILEK
ncbi:signal peptidase I [Erysipelothrix sp. HDW6C]|uniref:signal peptidase I n=1 Tax=Erysipelothrix sp. HDW6C TaxID=2714930 RepID=UPI001407BC56|nr:signal peptidase I [Erysipelothrix sp. HDW6C]QIK69366.1 signal peptidase I [Erysipelothrix sp. HDW6C]